MVQQFPVIEFRLELAIEKFKRLVESDAMLWIVGVECRLGRDRRYRQLNPLALGIPGTWANKYDHYIKNIC